MTRDRLLFSAASGVLAVQVLLDTSILPQRGTSAADHLSAVVGPLALLVAAVLAYPRLRDGARAALALALGVLAIEGGTIGIAAILAAPRAADWTALLLLPAGVALCWLAAVLLWRSRTRTGHRLGRQALVAVATAVGLFWFVLPVGIALLATHRPRAAVGAVSLGRPHRDVTLSTRDGLDLAAWYVPSRNGAAIVSFPTRAGRLGQARMLVRHGYGVLLVDMRGYDGSEGVPNAFGWGATADIDAAVAWLLGRPEVVRGRIGGIGFSVGGEQMLEAAAGNPGLRAVVSDGAGQRSVREALIRGVPGMPSLPKEAVQTLVLATLSGTLPPPSLRDVVARIAPRPVLLIDAGHGGGGEDLTGSYYRAAGQPKERWHISEAGHTGGFDARPAEYERRVVGFFDRALGLSGVASPGDDRSGRL